MKSLIKLFLLFTLFGSTCDEYEPDPGYEEEPAFQIAFENGTKNFIIQSESINKPKSNVIKNEFPGIDINATSTKYWITQPSGKDSFIINYKLFTFTHRKENWIQFDTIYLSECSLKNARLTHRSDTFLPLKNSYKGLVFYIKE